MIWLHWDLHSFRYTALAMVCLAHTGIVYILETWLVVLPPTLDDRLLQVGGIVESIGQRIRLTKVVRGVVTRNAEWREKVERWWNRHGVPESPGVPEEIKVKWEAEAKTWVDGIMKIEEERGHD